MMISQRTTQRLARRIWGTLFTLVIALAVLVQLGREAFPLLDDYRDDISALLGNRLGVNIEVGGLSADWSGLRPQIELNNVTVTSLQQEPIFEIQRATAELSLVDSLLGLSFRWRHLAFDNLETTLKQKDTGHWQIKHLEMRARAESNFTIKDPLDIFLFGRRVELNNVTFNLDFRTGHTSVLSIPSITLENDRDFHRARISAGVLDKQEEKGEHFTLIVEGTGDPRDQENFDASGYLALHQFPMERVVAAFAGSHWQAQDQQDWAEGHRLDLQLWYRGTTRKGMSFRGKLRSDGLPLEVPQSVVLPEQLTADVTGRWHSSEGWRLVLQEFALEWPEFRSPAINLQLSGGLDRPVTIGIDHLELEPWHQLAKQVGYIQGKAEGVLASLEPSGTMNHLALSLTDAEQGYFRLNAELENISLNSFRGSPAVEKLDGFVTASAFDGAVDIQSQNGFNITFPRVYAHTHKFDRANAHVGWQVDRKTKTAYVSSNQFELSDSEHVAKGLLHLILPTVRDGREPQMTLSVGIEQGPISLHKKFVPKVVPKNLRTWLDRSLSDGTATDLGFLYHGSIAKKPTVKAAIQFMANIHQANVAFDPHWPALEKADGKISLNNQWLDVYLNQGTLFNNNVKDAQIHIIPNPEDEGHALSISGQLNGTTQQAMALLQNSPVQKVLGSTFDTWAFGGNVSADIALQIPLKANAKGMRQKIAVDITQAKLDMPDINLAINNINGQLTFDSDQGLKADNLLGQVWGQPLSASIKSVIPANVGKNGERDTVIQFKAPVAIKDLRQWTHRPELGFIEGLTQVAGAITIPARNTVEHFLEVEVKSQLSGVGVQLPKPLHKAENKLRPFALNLRAYDGFQRYELAYDNVINMHLQTGDNIESSGLVLINPAQDLSDNQTKPILKPGFFDVVGNIEYFDLDVWDEVHERYLGYLKEEQQEDGDADLPVRLNVDVGVIRLGDATIDKAHVNGLGTQQQWAFNLDSELTRGNVIVKGSEDNIHLTFELDYLRFVSAQQLAENSAIAGTLEAEPAEYDEWPLAEIDLSKVKFPAAFSVKELTFDGEPYGRWSFDIKPLSDGVSLTNIHGNIRGMAVGEAIADLAIKEVPVATTQGRRTSRSGAAGYRTTVQKPKLNSRQEFIQSVKLAPHAEFIWRQTPEGNHSYFNGTIMAKNAGDLLEAWGVEKVLDSRQSLVRAEVSWLGAPDEINLKTVVGDVVFDMEDGEFIRGANAGDNGLLRLIALFNFDTIARRLKLDFSDLAKEGFGFESVHGEFDFEDGWIYINEPMVVYSTSSKLQVAGTLDVIDEKIDAELVATLPVAGDITVAAALIAGLPAAIGVFVISKMFEEQVDKASSISYNVTGEWEDPKIKFRKIFDDTAASAKGKEVKLLDRDGQRTQTQQTPRPDNYDPPKPTPVPE